jgi:sodium transport system permease protein
VSAPAPSRFGRLGRLMLKEQKEILRDRRTLLTLIVMPLLLYPLVGLVIQQFMTAVGNPRTPTYFIGLESNEHAAVVGQLIQLADLSAPPRATRRDVPELQYIVLPPDELRQRLRAGLLDVLVYVRGAASDEPGKPIAFDLEFMMVRGRKLSEEAGRYLRAKLDSTSKIILAKRLAELNVPQRPEPIRIEARTMEPPDKREGFPLGSVAPFMLILMTITGAVYPAIDLTAGERERGTLEMLMAAPVPRMSILVAKYAAVLTVALLTALVNIGAMTATLYLTDVGRLVVGEGGLSAKTIVQGLAALVLFVGFFSALLLALASFARSFKEAQAYLIPLMLVALAPGVVSLFPGVELTAATAAAPLLNIVLFSRDLLQDGVDGWLTAIVLVANACYAAAALVLAARLFGSEGVLYGGSGSWSGLTRRPATPREFVPPSSAAFLVMLCVPAFLLLTGLGRLLFPNNLVGQMLAGAVVLSFVFVVAPFAVAWSRNVPPKKAFAFVRPRFLPLLAAVLLGASLWPFAVKLLQSSRTTDLIADNPEIAQRLTSFVEEIRRIPPTAGIVLLAVIPAICEEIFFRGFLFGALVRRSVLNAVVTTTTLFAAFHVLSPSSLTPERFAPSLMLGLALGLLRWRSGSIWPGVVMHVAHNSIVIAAMLIPTKFGFTADVGGTVNVPNALYLAGGVGAAVGLALLMSARPRTVVER